MSDNLAYKLNSANTANKFSPPTTDGNILYSPVSPSPELTLRRQVDEARRVKEQAEKGPVPERNNIIDASNRFGKKPESDTNTKKENGDSSKLSQASNIAKDLAKGDISASLATHVGSQWVLTTMWGAVWLDYTLLTLLGLNVFLVASLMLPNYVCQFGEDYLFGKWLPDKGLAKIVEIILLMIINLIVATILFMIIYLAYLIINNPIEFWWRGVGGIGQLEG